MSLVKGSSREAMMAQLASPVGAAIATTQVIRNLAAQRLSRRAHRERVVGVGDERDAELARPAKLFHLSLGVVREDAEAGIGGREEQGQRAARIGDAIEIGGHVFLLRMTWDGAINDCPIVADAASIRTDAGSVGHNSD